jgi:hypothetical protein
VALREAQDAAAAVAAAWAALRMHGTVAGELRTHREMPALVRARVKAACVCVSGCLGLRLCLVALCVCACLRACVRVMLCFDGGEGEGVKGRKEVT